jgi:lysyl-tRNA synthetase class 2
MKELLASREGFERIFSLSYCFRDEPESPIHRPQFLMLEWYRKNARYEEIMKDVEGLIGFCIREGKERNLPVRKDFETAKLVKKTMQELFQEELGLDILSYLEKDSIKELLKKFPDVPVPQSELEWDDYFFLLFLNKIEPNLKRYPLLLLSEFPAPLSALSTLKANDLRVCERFEVYVNGIELCNCFNELTDAEELRKRFNEQNASKRRLYGYELPEARRFLATMDKGYPPSAGIALGVERLLSSLFEVEDPFYF